MDGQKCPQRRIRQRAEHAIDAGTPPLCSRCFFSPRDLALIPNQCTISRWLDQVFRAVRCPFGNLHFHEPRTAQSSPVHSGVRTGNIANANATCAVPRSQLEPEDATGLAYWTDEDLLESWLPSIIGTTYQPKIVRIDRGSAMLSLQQPWQ
jgi:hypothetical protein